MLSGYSSNLPSDVLLSTGIIMIGSNKIGATRGSPQFNPGREIENTEFDGKLGPPLKGLDRIFHGEPEISGSLIEFGDSSTGNQIAKLEPGSSSASAGSPNVTTITPKTGGAYLASGDYLTDVRLIFERGIGTGTKLYAAIYFPYALVKEWGPLQGDARKGEATIPFKIVGRKDPSTGTLSDAAYKIELREALP